MFSFAFLFVSLSAVFNVKPWHFSIIIIIIISTSTSSFWGELKVRSPLKQLKILIHLINKQFY